ncbi:MAG: Trm112 family protein [Pseudomonadota bacterium]
MSETEDTTLQSDAKPGEVRTKLDIDVRMLELLVCPLTHGRLHVDLEKGELVSPKAKLAYPVRGGIPIMLASEAREMAEDELVNYVHR